MEGIFTEARAAYLLAEESFSVSDWKGTLSYLEECRKKIGKPNSKILYLQLMAELELAKTDSAYYLSSLKTINDFEKAPDAKDFNEDKTLEVMKIKLRLKRMLETVEKEKLAKEERATWMQTLGGVVVVEKDGHGLVMANTDLGKMIQSEALKACEALELNGYSDWRLPSVEEFGQMNIINTQLITSKLLPAGFVVMKGNYITSFNYKNYPSYRKILKTEYAVRPVRSF